MTVAEVEVVEVAVETIDPMMVVAEAEEGHLSSQRAEAVVVVAAELFF